jgi:hypothetical protein
MTTETGDSCRLLFTIRISRALPLLVALPLGLFCGCENAEMQRVEMRRRATLERMIYSGGTLQERRAQDDIISQLRRANARTLSCPQVVFAEVTDDVNDVGADGIVRVEWIAAKPFADGVRFAFSDDVFVDVPIPKEFQEYNAVLWKAEGSVLFVAQVYLRQERPKLWAELVTDERVQVCLLLQGQHISICMPLTRRSIAVR